MSVFGTVIQGRATGVRCDGCGRISRDDHGYYWNRKLERGGNISGRGRQCEHDFCDECEQDGLLCWICKTGFPDEGQAKTVKDSDEALEGSEVKNLRSEGA